MFVLGGSNITYNEILIAKKNKIPIEYYPLERKFLGDKLTKTKKNMPKKEKIGITYKLQPQLKTLLTNK